MGFSFWSPLFWLRVSASLFGRRRGLHYVEMANIESLKSDIRAAIITEKANACPMTIRLAWHASGTFDKKATPVSLRACPVFVLFSRVPRLKKVKNPNTHTPGRLGGLGWGAYALRSGEH